MNITYHQVSSDRQENRDILSQGVVGVKCVDAAHLNELLKAKALNFDQLCAVIQVLDDISHKGDGHYVGTVEVYENGALNLYIKKIQEVVAHVIIRSENSESKPD